MWERVSERTIEKDGAGERARGKKTESCCRMPPTSYERVGTEEKERGVK